MEGLQLASDLTAVKTRWTALMLQYSYLNSREIAFTQSDKIFQRVNWRTNSIKSTILLLLNGRVT